MDDKVKDLLDKIRGAADLACDTATDTARYASKRAGQMVDVAKLNVQLFDLNAEFNDTLRQLGQVMYDTHLGRDLSGEAVTGLLTKADDTATKVTEVKTRIKSLRQASPCPGCGSPCGSEDAFCSHCGEKLK